MASVISESFVARASYLSDEKERQIDKLQRQFYELKKQCDKYFDDLDDVENMCKQAKKNMKTADWYVTHNKQKKISFAFRLVQLASYNYPKWLRLLARVDEILYSLTNKLLRVKNFEVFRLTRDK